MQPAIGDRAPVGPGPEHRADRTPQLVFRPVREVLPGLGGDDAPVGLDQAQQVVGVQPGVERDPLLVPGERQRFLEQVRVHAHDHVRVHLDEPPVAVVGEPGIAGARRKPVGGLRVQAQVEHRVHHAGHRHPRTRADRHEERVGPVAERRAALAFHERDAVANLCLEARWPRPGVGAVAFAGLGGDGEPGRDRQAEAAHLGQVGALAAEQLVHRGVAFGSAAAETVDPLGHDARSSRALMPRCPRNRRPGSSSG